MIPGDGCGMEVSTCLILCKLSSTLVLRPSHQPPQAPVGKSHSLKSPDTGSSWGKLTSCEASTDLSDASSIDT